MNRSPDEEYCPSSESSPHEEKQGPSAPNTQLLPAAPFLFVANDPPQRIGPGKSLSPKKKASRKRKWRKPKDMPKRPLSAYNIFFHDERKNIASQIAADNVQNSAASGSSMGFAGLAQAVARKWKTLGSTSRAYYEAEAAKEQLRYRLEVDEWSRRKKDKAEDESDIDSNSHFGGSSQHHDSIQLPLTTSQERDSTFSSASGSLVSSLWPSLPQSVESLGPWYGAHMNEHAYSQVSQMPSRQAVAARGAMELEIEPARLNPRQMMNARQSDAATSSLHQLASELDDDELDFLSSLK